jgi:hypothetical protein
MFSNGQAAAIGAMMFIYDITTSQTPLQEALSQTLFFAEHRRSDSLLAAAFARPLYPARTFKRFESAISLHNTSANAINDNATNNAISVNTSAIRASDVYYKDFDDLLTRVNLLYDENKRQYIRSMRTEITSLISVLRGYYITIDDKFFSDSIYGKRLGDKRSLVPVGYDTTLSISPSFVSENPKAYLRLYSKSDTNQANDRNQTIADHTNQADANAATKTDEADLADLTLREITLSDSYDVIGEIIKANNERYNEFISRSLNTSSALNDSIVSNALKHSAIFIEVSGITLKYDLTYETKYKSKNFWNANDRYYHIKLTECKSNVANQEDYDLIARYKAEQENRQEGK